MTYALEFKEAIVRRLLLPNGPKLTELSLETGVAISTIWHWRKKFAGDDHLKKERRPQDWSAEEKFMAMMETGSMSEGELGSYYRRNGLTSDQLQLWKETCLASIRKGPKVDPEKKNLEKELRSLKRDLNRKEKALAETAALLVLKKKAAALWEWEEEA